MEDLVEGGHVGVAVEAAGVVGLLRMAMVVGVINHVALFLDEAVDADELREVHELLLRDELTIVSAGRLRATDHGAVGRVLQPQLLHPQAQLFGRQLARALLHLFHQLAHRRAISTSISIISTLHTALAARFRSSFVAIATASRVDWSSLFPSRAQRQLALAFACCIIICCWA
ncbi:hypothetical protein GOP47_0003552 [Adiantum capillus-veneris]|uniref:Uncharacterized protein n=1 Tax=Adiantum capillus-veneris TaxID=13818 RepID=A0A9D4VD11_ADICA|nr:hypothetical protein GOP47_0003552 [Adiantum capillus-veneris]